MGAIRRNNIPLNDIVNQCKIDPTSEKESVRTRRAIRKKYQSASNDAVGWDEVGNFSPQKNLKEELYASRIRKCIRNQGSDEIIRGGEQKRASPTPTTKGDKSEKRQKPYERNRLIEKHTI